MKPAGPMSQRRPVGTQCLAAVSLIQGNPRQKKPEISKWRNLYLAEEIYILKNVGQLEPVREQKFDLESVFQQLVADHPELLSGQRMDPDNPRRWILVDREQGIPDIVGGGNRWASDHLLIDQDAIPTLAEVKRSEEFGNPPHHRRGNFELCRPTPAIQPGGGTVRIGGRVPWGAEVEYAYRAGLRQPGPGVGDPPGGRAGLLRHADETGAGRRWSWGGPNLP